MVRPIAKIQLTNFFAPLIVILKTNFNVSLRHFVFTIVGNVMGIETVRMAVMKILQYAVKRADAMLMIGNAVLTILNAKFSKSIMQDVYTL